MENNYNGEWFNLVVALDIFLLHFFPCLEYNASELKTLGVLLLIRKFFTCAVADINGTAEPDC